MNRINQTKIDADITRSGQSRKGRKSAGKLILIAALIFVVCAALSGCGSSIPEKKASAVEMAVEVKQMTTALADIHETFVQAKQCIKSSAEDLENVGKPGRSNVYSSSDSENDNDSDDKKTVALDAGHAATFNQGEEAIGPDTNETKLKMTSGATGAFTRAHEYELTLTIAKLLKKELESRDYKVYMVRENNNFKAGCKDRALAVNDSGADICIRIHADSADESSAHGASALYKTTTNEYATEEINAKSKRLSQTVLDSMCSATGTTNRGLVVRNDLTGNNWSKVPVTLIEMGFMSNEKDDRNMQDANFQKKIVKGMADGIDQYYK